jgi:3-deoxy-D-manno-octulosonic-acid transferase
MLPLFILRRKKYASGFRERLGNYPRFENDERPVIWLHCVSVGETNAARPLVDILRDRFPTYRLVISTTTRTGQDLALSIFNDKAEAVVYFPFDWKFSVRRALENIRPSVVLLMETEIWPRFIREAKRSGAKVAIVNGRLSEKSFRRYSIARSFVKAVLNDIDLALMQSASDAERICDLGVASSKVSITGNLKFESTIDDSDASIAASLAQRFGISGGPPVVIAASTHDPEEKIILDAMSVVDKEFRLMIAPRHPQRFDDVAETITAKGWTLARRSEVPAESDKTAKAILLDSIGELRAAYRLADVAFVGGSLIPHGGQSVLEPAAAGKAIVTGPYTFNFEAVINAFRDRDAIIQMAGSSEISVLKKELSHQIVRLLNDDSLRERMGSRAKDAVNENRGAAAKTVKRLYGLLPGEK